VAHKVIYVDTDSSFVQDGGANISPQLNDLVQEWSLTRFGRPSTIRFEYEGHFDRILILSKCHYYGYLQGVKKPEIKGIEAKRANSCKYEAKFQEELINRVLDGQSKQQVTEWIRSETLAITTFPCEEMAFPSKITAENPSFEVNSALLSRTKVFVLKALETDQIIGVLKRALADKVHGFGKLKIKIAAKDLAVIADTAFGNVSGGD
jgi:hypothetical protein